MNRIQRAITFLVPFFDWSVLRAEGEFSVQYGRELSVVGYHTEAIAQLNDAAKYQTNTSLSRVWERLKARGWYEKAEQVYRHAFLMIPNRFFPLYKLAMLYAASEQHPKAVQMTDEVMNKEIKVPSTAITEIKEEMTIVMSAYRSCYPCNNFI